MSELTEVRHIFETTNHPTWRVAGTPPPPKAEVQDPQPPKRPYLKKRAKGTHGWFEVIPPPESWMEQLYYWVEGVSLHYGKECCPDFSCCIPELRAPKRVRERYLEAFDKNDNDTKVAIALLFYTAVARVLVPDKEITFEGFGEC